MDFGAYEAHQEYLNPPVHHEDGSGYRDFFVRYGGESTAQVYERMERTIREVLEASKEDETLLFVSHGGVIMQFYLHATKNPPAPKKTSSKLCDFQNNL